jgi:hypothetical protein
MPLNTTTITLGEELERLREEYRQLDAAAANDDADAGGADGDAGAENDGTAPDGDGVSAALDALRAHQRRKVNGVGYLADEYGHDAAVTVGGLTMQDKALVLRELSTVKNEAAAVGMGEIDTVGLDDLYEAAAGLVDAPFLPDDVDAADPMQFSAVVDELGGEYPQVTRWLVDRVRVATELPDHLGNG